MVLQERDELGFPWHPAFGRRPRATGGDATGSTSSVVDDLSLSRKWVLLAYQAPSTKAPMRWTLLWMIGLVLAS